MQRVSLICFNNAPRLKEVRPADREQCLKRHRDWEVLCSDTPPGTLHHCVLQARNRNVIYRQTVAWLIAQYCTKHRLAEETLVKSITDAWLASPDGGAGSKSFHKTRAEDGRKEFNLLKLDDDTLWEVYCAIPADARRAEPPKPPPEHRERPPRKKARRGERRGGVKSAIKSATVSTKEGGDGMLLTLNVVFEKATWICCDLCEKWRRVPGVREEDIPEKWCCDMHPDNITCDVPEEPMEEDEKWSGEMSGARYGSGESGAGGDDGDDGDDSNDGW